MKLRKLYIFLELIIVFCLPVIFIATGLLDFEDRFFMALCVFFYVLIIVLLEKWRLSDYGFPGITKILHGWKEHTFFTAIFALVAIVFGLYFGEKIDFQEMKHSYFNPVYLFLLCIVQEFVYRVFLITKLESIFQNKHIVVFVSSLVFGLLHIMFVPVVFVVGMTFIAGFLWGYLYIQYRNLLLLTFSHMVLNGIATYFCLIQGFPGCV